MTCLRPHSKLVGESRIESEASDFQPSASTKACSYQAGLKKLKTKKQTTKEPQPPSQTPNAFYLKKIKKEESGSKK